MSASKPYAVVALIEDLSEHCLQRGQVGAIVDELGPEVYFAARTPQAISDASLISTAALFDL